MNGDKMNIFTLEVCVDSVESAINAERGGADRLELCGNLVIGGTTPPLSLYKEVKKYVKIPIRVMIRPRFGDFLYTKYEKEMMLEDMETFKKLGVDGAVFGALTENGEIDMEISRELVEKADRIPVTFHRAFDLCKDPVKAYNQLQELRIDTLLTSGQKNSCFEGKELIKKLIFLSQNSKQKKPEILIGGGLNIDNVEEIIEYTVVRSFHISAKKIVDSRMIYRKKGISMGINEFNEYKKIETEEKIVREMKEPIRSYFIKLCDK